MGRSREPRGDPRGRSRSPSRRDQNSPNRRDRRDPVNPITTTLSTAGQITGKFTDGFDPFQQRYNTQQTARTLSNPTTPIEWLATRQPRTELAQRIEDFLVEIFNADLHPTDLPADSLRKIPKDQYMSLLAKLNLLHASICAQIHFAINRIRDPQRCIFVNSKAEVGDIGNVLVFDGLKNHQIPVQDPCRVPSIHGPIIVKQRCFILISKDMKDPRGTFCVAWFTTFEGKGGPSRADPASKYVRAVAGQAPDTQDDDEDLKVEEELFEQDMGSNLKPQRLQEGMKVPEIRLNTSAKSFSGPAPSYANVQKPIWIPHDAAIRWVGKVAEGDYSRLIPRLESGSQTQLLVAHRIYCIKNNLPVRLPGLPEWEQPQPSEQTATDDCATSATQHNLSPTQSSPTDSTATYTSIPQSNNDPPAVPHDSSAALPTDPRQDSRVAVPPDNTSPSTTDQSEPVLSLDSSPQSSDLRASETPAPSPASNNPLTPEPESDVVHTDPSSTLDAKLDSEEPKVAAYGAAAAEDFEQDW